MISFENFVKSVTPSLSELKVTPSFCLAFKIPDAMTEINAYITISEKSFLNGKPYMGNIVCT